MLGSYMEDIGITAKEFEAACTQGKSITGKFHQQLFEQVLPSFLFLFPSHNCFRFGPRMTMRFSREWWSRRTLICKWKHWSCYNKGTNPWQIPNEKVKIQNPCQNPNEKVKSRIQIPGMECFLSLSNLPRSLLQWRGRIKLCRRWQGSTKNEIILCNSQIFRKHIQSYAESDKVRPKIILLNCHIFWKHIHR